MKAEDAVIVLVITLLVVGYLEWRNAPTEEAIRKDPPLRSQLSYPCETWIRQSGGGKPIFACIKASQ